MVKFVLLLACFIAFVSGQGGDPASRTCRQKYEKVGCFKDRVVPDRPLTIQLLNRMDKYSRKWDGQIINWKHYQETLYKLACKCAELTLAKGYMYFGIQFYGECWTGPANETFSRDGPSKDCVGGKFASCNDNSTAECTGKCFSNYIYKVHKPVNGGWGLWSKWSNCTGKCGNDGTQTRTRKCDNPKPQHGGKVCNPKESQQTQKCSSKPCSAWTTWGSWGDCMKTRQRACVIQGTNTPSKDCPGNDDETKKCEDCVGKWAKWGNWGECISEVPCGKGTAVRRRECLPKHLKCVGDASETRSCFHQCNPTWGNWGQWSRCTTSCGPGNRKRRRVCYAIDTNVQVTGCPGSNEEPGRCSLRDCPKWSWGPWTACQGRCGTIGSRRRSGVCRDPITNQPTTGCPGRAPSETGSCSMPRCPPTWTAWSVWGICSQTCGSGSRARSRTCVFGGTTTVTSGCSGSSRETQGCLLPKCRDPCDLPCIPEDFEQPICGRTINNNRKIQFPDNCSFKRAACNNKLLVRNNHGKCLFFPGEGGNGGGGLGGGGGTPVAQ